MVDKEKDSDLIYSEEADYVCHIHDSRNRHIGTGRDKDSPVTALSEAANDAGEVPEKGSFGCGTTDEQAHERAKELNPAPVMDLPGAGNDKGSI